MGNRSSKRKDPNDTSVDLRDFIIKETIGRGAFGKVKIIKKRANQELYALKYIEKKRCIRKNAVKNIFEERALLESLNHPSLINLRYAFQDDDHMFFVMDLALGGDLRFHINCMAEFGEKTLQCYAAEACLALEYLHSQNIIHRDLKPDNFLLDKDGHLHLCDFNVCFKVIDGVFPHRRAGTLVYMAPELFKSEPYDYSVDYWSLGVTLYECFYRQRPFSGKDRKRLMRAIAEKPLVFPEEKFNPFRESRNSVTKAAKKSAGQLSIITPEFQDFITQLLNRDAALRLGGFGKPFQEAIVNHPFMRTVDWDAANSMRLDPPYKPNPKRRNFDAMYQVEDVLMEDGLTYKKRKSKKLDKSKNTGTGNGERPTSTSSRKSELLNPLAAIPKFNKSAKGGDKQQWFEEVLEFIDQHFKPYNYETRDGMLDLAGTVLPDVSGHEKGISQHDSETADELKNDGTASHDELSFRTHDDM